MCNRPSTLQRVLRSIRALSPAGRAEVRRHLNAAPAAPSLRDALQQARTPRNHDERLRAAITPTTPRS